MRIRPAIEADLHSIAQFQIAMAWETERKELQLETILPGVGEVLKYFQRGFYLVVETKQRIVASLLVTYEWSDWRNSNIWYLQSVYVQPEFRGQGIFRKMYEEVVAMAREAGSSVIRLYVEVDNQPAQRVYESIGMNRLPYVMYEAQV